MDMFEEMVDAALDELDIDEFTSTFKIRTRLPRSRRFPVTGGTVTVTSSASWDRPASCKIGTYTIRLWREEWWRDGNHGAFTFTVGGRQVATWKDLPSGTYYLEIHVRNSNPNCVLLGNIEVS